MREKQTETEDIVKLKPIMGIRPGIYLTALYSVILLVILFFLLIFPGIKNPGVVLRLKTEPDGAALRVNGVYAGTSKDKIFISKGTHTLEAVLPGFESKSGIYEIPGRIFGSLFFPQRFPVEITLELKNPSAAFAEAVKEFVSWSFAGEPNAVWQIPLSLSEGAYRTGPSQDPFTSELLTAAARFTITRASLRDLVRAKFLLDNSGLSPSPVSLTGTVSDILQFLSDNPGSATWLSGILPPESAAKVKSSEWEKNAFNTLSQTTLPETGTAQNSNFSFQGLSFITITEGLLQHNETIPHNTLIKSFMISQTPVTQSLFETFLYEEPLLRPSLENDYFNTSDLTNILPGQEDVITNISWNTANSFCQWLTKKLPPFMADMEVRLPTEAEWEYAVKSGITRTGIWEWCVDPYVHLPFIKASPEVIQIIGSPEQSLRGRLNTVSSSSSTEMRASLPPDFSSPVVTFRPVITAKNE